MAKVTFTFEGERRVADLGAGPVVCGRSSEAGLRIQGSGISRVHAEFRPTATGWEVEDLKSSNGTFVNGERVQRRDLRHGDRVRLNEFELLFEDVPADKSTEVPVAAPAPEPAPPPVVAAPAPPRAPPLAAAPAVSSARASEDAPGTRALSPEEVADALQKAKGGAEVESSTRALDPDEIMGTLQRLRAADQDSPASAPPAEPQGLPVEEGPGGTRPISPEEMLAAMKALRPGPTGIRPLSSGEADALRRVGPTGTLPRTPAGDAPPPPQVGPTGTIPRTPGPAIPRPSPSSSPATTEEMLARIPLFAGVAPALLKTLAAESQFHVFAPRAVVCREGEYTADFYVLLTGMIGVYKADTSQGGRVLHLASLPPGSFFGEMSCMSHAPRSATVIAESDVVAVSIPRHTFLKVYGDRKSPKFKEVIDKAYRERALRNHLASLAIFRGLDAATLAKVGEKAELQIAEKGAVIAGAGKAADGVYLVRTGHAKLVSRPGPGEEILAWFCENSFFGVKTLVDDVAPGTSMIAVDRMDLVRIPAAALEALVVQFPALRRTILENAEAAGRPTAAAALSEEEAEARRRAREIGAGSEVIKAGDALVIDMSKCTRCNMCVEGCIDAHEDHIPRIGKRGLKYGDLLLTSSCYNCKVPDCMLACKFGAIRRDRKGQVQIDPDACTGCSLCEPACPYGTIHMQSLVDDEGLRTLASVGPVKALLQSLPLVGKLLWKGKQPAAKTGEAVPQAPAPAVPGAPAGPAAGAPAAGEKKEERKKLRQAVKCDLCAGRSDMACIASCPCGAIERIDPSYLLSG